MSDGKRLIADRHCKLYGNDERVSESSGRQKLTTQVAEYEADEY